jgi:hypothetical protein
VKKYVPEINLNKYSTLQIPNNKEQKQKEKRGLHPGMESMA